MQQDNPGRDLREQGTENQVQGGMDQLGGRIQEGLGNLTGNDDAAREGEARQAKGGVQRGAGDLQNKAGDALDNLRDKVQDGLDHLRGQSDDQSQPGR